MATGTTRSKGSQEEQSDARTTQESQESTKPLKFYERLAQVQSELASVSKTGNNTHQNYRYAKEGDFIEAIRPILNKWGLFLTAECVSHSLERFEICDNKGQLKTVRAATVEIQCEVIDVMSGEKLTRRMPGYAEDASDKALYKAITGATKYAIWKTFGLSTADDPEADSAHSSYGNFSAPRNTKGSVPREPSSGHLPFREDHPLIQKSTALLRDLNWSDDDGRTYLHAQYRKNRRVELTYSQLTEFVQYLESLKTIETTTA